MDEQFLFRGIICGAVAVIIYFLRRLHTQLDESATRTELLALKDKVERAVTRDEIVPLISKMEAAVSKVDFDITIKNLRLEHESDRRELRDNQIKLFDKFEIIQQLLTQVATQVAMLIEGRRNGDHPRQ